MSVAGTGIAKNTSLIAYFHAVKFIRHGRRDNNGLRHDRPIIYLPADVDADRHRTTLLLKKGIRFTRAAFIDDIVYFIHDII